MTPHFRRLRIYTNPSLFSSCKRRLAKGKKMTRPGTRFAPAATVTLQFSPAPPTAGQNKPACSLLEVTQCMSHFRENRMPRFLISPEPLRKISGDGPPCGALLIGPPHHYSRILSQLRPPMCTPTSHLLSSRSNFAGNSRTTKPERLKLVPSNSISTNGRRYTRSGRTVGVQTTLKKDLRDHRLMTITNSHQIPRPGHP